MNRRFKRRERWPSKIPNQWEFLKDYINKRNIGDLISRKDLIYLTFDGPPPPTDSYTRTFDVYLMALTRIGILEKVQRGVYRIKNHINGEITSTKLIKIAYSRDFRVWFNDVIKI